VCRYNPRVRILISAGEASGEMYGAQLIEALRKLHTREAGEGPVRLRSGQVRSTQCLEFFGVGGPKMRAAGCDTIIDAKDLAVVGITEIVSHLPKIWGLFHQLIAEADQRKADLAVVIDSPAFNWRVARQMKKRGVPVVYYVCPQFWAWRQGRVKLLRKYVDKALVIFPFEEKFYRDRGVNAEFLGHPLADLAPPTVSREEYAAEQRLETSKHWITLMPGSRAKEVRMNLPAMVQTAQLLGKQCEFVLPTAPTVSRSLIHGLLNATDSKITVHLVPEALPALAHSRAAIVASGTATVEAALMETPFVMVYRVTALTYLLGRSTVKVPHFAMPNLIAGERIVSELVQHDFTPENALAELTKIIPDGLPRENMLQGLRRVRTLLRGDGGSQDPIERAARAVLETARDRTVTSAR
jgi:lipid-A-disaccharide synthase